MHLAMNHCMLAEDNDLAWSGDHEVRHHRGRLLPIILGPLCLPLTIDLRLRHGLDDLKDFVRTVHAR